MIIGREIKVITYNVKHCAWRILIPDNSAAPCSKMRIKTENIKDSIFGKFGICGSSKMNVIIAYGFQA